MTQGQDECLCCCAHGGLAASGGRLAGGKRGSCRAGWLGGWRLGESSRLVVGEGVVRVAVQTAIARLRRGNNGVRRRVGVLGRVAIRRVVATQGRAALLTRAQMDPSAANLYALIALVPRGGFHCRNRFDVSTAVVSHPIPSLVLERPMNQGDSDRSFAHSGRHPLDVAAPYIANGKHSRQAGFKKIGRTG